MIPQASDRYFDLLESYARSAADTDFLAELARRRAELTNVAPKLQTYWLF